MLRTIYMLSVVLIALLSVSCAKEEPPAASLPASTVVKSMFDVCVAEYSETDCAYLQSGDFELERTNTGSPKYCSSCTLGSKICCSGCEPGSTNCRCGREPC